MLSEGRYLLVPFVTLVVCQIIKFTIESIREKKFKFGRLFNGTGGMPSSHSSFTFALTFTILFNEGINSSLFALSLIFSTIVAYDAMGLRMESGKQAHAINILVDEIFEKDHDTVSDLKEQIGHKPLEVFMGIVFALVMSAIFQIKL